MAETKSKGDLGEAMVMADILRRGYKVAIPIGEDWRYDLIMLRKGKLERVQCKYTKSNGKVITIKCRSTNTRIARKYTIEEIDWLAAYDKTTDTCYYIPSSLLGPKGLTEVKLRLTVAGNNQHKRIRWAKDFTVL